MKKLLILALIAVLAMSLTPAALAAKNPTVNADDLNFEAIIDDTDAAGTVNIYHWWTAGGEKDAIESVVSEFSGIYENISGNFLYYKFQHQLLRDQVFLNAL